MKLASLARAAMATPTVTRRMIQRLASRTTRSVVAGKCLGKNASFLLDAYVYGLDDKGLNLSERGMAALEQARLGSCRSLP
jgi:hypothetical protein